MDWTPNFIGEDDFFENQAQSVIYLYILQFSWKTSKKLVVGSERNGRLTDTWLLITNQQPNRGTIS